MKLRRGLLIIVTVAGAATPAAFAAPNCRPSPADARFFQLMLDDWSTMTGEVLRLPARPLPWIVLYDRACVYHIAPDTATAVGRATRPIGGTRLAFAGAPVAIRGAPAGKAVALPNGREVPIAGLAFTGIYGDSGRERPFFVTALPDVWANDPKYAADTNDQAEFVREVVAHELVHALAITGIARKLDSLQQRHPRLPSDLDDDLIQRGFMGRPAVDSAMRREIAMLYEAVAERDDGAARSLARRALDLLRERRAKYFADSADAYAPMEDVFLNMEGSATWGALQLTIRRNPGTPPADVLGRFRGGRKWWSQEEGLSLFLLVDRWVPGWVARVLPPELASPVALLGEALSDRGRGAPQPSH